MADEKLKQAVEAIRNDELVGRGSCTSIDECYSDDELSEELLRAGATTIEQAVKWARDSEGLWLEQACNARWGEDDDPQLVDLHEWGEKRQSIE
jgi:hypothetical protein